MYFVFASNYLPYLLYIQCKCKCKCNRFVHLLFLVVRRNSLPPTSLSLAPQKCDDAIAAVASNAFSVDAF